MLHTSIISEIGDLPDFDWAHWSENAAERIPIRQDAYVSVVFVSQKRIQELNKQYRSVDAVTDVLSFAQHEGGIEYQDEEQLGDIFICFDKAMEQAREYDSSLDAEVELLFIHGLLHLLGFDHMDEDDKVTMRAMEEKILSHSQSRL